jgi:tetratricopeptide (TPR) repeat protein
MRRNGLAAARVRNGASVIRLPSPVTANSSQTRAGQGAQQERKMYQVKGSKRIMVGLVLSSAALAACDTEAKPDNTQKPVVVAQVTAAEMQPTTTDTNVTTPKPVNVKYQDAADIFRKGRYAEAAVLFSVYAEENPNQAHGQYMLGLSAWKSGDRETAVKALTKAVMLDTTSAKAHTNLARVLLEQGKAIDALTYAQIAVELAPESHEVWRVLGNAHAELGGSDSAMAAYRQALVINSKDAWTMNNYGLVLIKLGRYEDALRPLARAVELMPNSAVFHNNLGVAFERSGWLGGARNAFNAAVEADSSYAKAKISLARVLEELGDRTDESPELSTLARSFVEEMERWRTNPIDVGTQQ